MVDVISKTSIIETYSKVKLRRISISKLSLIFSIFGLFLGLLSGFFFFLFIQFSILALEIETPIFGLFLVSFLVFPIVYFLVFGLLGFISGLIFNLSLKISKGLEMLFEELD